jgi:hypothetical protein
MNEHFLEKEFIKFDEKCCLVCIKLEDTEVIEWLKQVDPEERVELTKRALKIGLTALSSAFVGGTTQVIREAIEKWKVEIESSMNETINKSKETILQKISEQFGRQVIEPVVTQIDQVTRGLSEKIRDHLISLEKRIDPNHPESWLKVVNDIVNSLKTEFDPNREGSYLWRIKGTLIEFYGHSGEAYRCISEAVNNTIKQTNEILNEISKTLEEIKIRLGGLSISKGRAFEKESIRDLLYRAISVTGDKCEYTGYDNRPGDWVIEVMYGNSPTVRQSIGRVVIEAKDVSSLTKSKVVEIINGAMKERVADAGILLLAHISQNPYNLPFMAITDDFTKLVCVWDENGLNLNFAYQLARLIILEKHLRTSSEFDWSEFKRQLADIMSDIEKLSEIERFCGLSKGHSENAERLCKELKNNLIYKIKKAQEILSKINK